MTNNPTSAAFPAQLTKREYAAIQIMAGMCADAETWMKACMQDAESDFAGKATRMADALLKELGE